MRCPSPSAPFLSFLCESMTTLKKHVSENWCKMGFSFEIFSDNTFCQSSHKNKLLQKCLFITLIVASVYVLFHKEIDPAQNTKKMFVWHIKAEVKYCISNFWVVSTNQNAKKYLSNNNYKFNKKSKRFETKM